MKILQEWLNPHTNKYKCPHCSKEFSYMGISTHIWRMHGNGVNHVTPAFFKKGNKSWNKGLTVNSDDRVRRNRDTLIDRYKSGEIVAYIKGKKHKPETIQKLKQNAGGVRKGAGRGKSGWYSGYWCDSTWELAWVIYHLDHNITFIRNTVAFPYEWKNESHLYYPDFVYDDGTLIEIKGYITDHTKAKFNSVKSPYILKILTKHEIQPYLDYVTKKYNGINLITLYDNTSRYKTKICPSCNNSFIPKIKTQVCCCRNCFKDHMRHVNPSHKVDMLTMNDLIKEIKESNFVLVGRKYGVSDNTIRKWCIGYGIDPKSLSSRKNIDKSLKKIYINNMKNLQQQQQNVGEATQLV